jgi:hypothetical protein
MFESEATFNDKDFREETKQVWRDLGNSDELRDGPFKGVDLVSVDYDIEVAFSTIWGGLRSEWRLEQRKLKYWAGDRPTHYIVFNQNRTECVIWGNTQIRKWIVKYPVEYRKCKGWNRLNSYFLIIPLVQTFLMKSLKKTEKKWVLTQPTDTYR